MFQRVHNGIVALILCSSFVVSSAMAGDGQWKTYKVEYKWDPELKKGPTFDWKGWACKSKDLFQKSDGATGTIRIPADMKPGETIRGVAENYGFGDFAHRNRIALIKGATAPYGVPHKTFLAAAAKACGHPEVEHAGFISGGLSNGGRFAAHGAYFWPDRVIAVILDHSWCNPNPDYKTDIFEYGTLPMAPGIPYFFNAAQKDKFQGFNRRKLHYEWCKNAFKGKQPCTSVISYEDVKHGRCGTRSLQKLWLEEVLALRVPAYIDPGGSPYTLKPVNPKAQGGWVYAELDESLGRTIHVDVVIGPVKKVKKPTWWVPGPKSASMIVEWVKKNEGTVAGDGSFLINKPINTTYTPKRLRSIGGAIENMRLKSAMTAIDVLLAKCESGQEDKKHIVALNYYKRMIEGWLTEHLEDLKQIHSTGDIYYFSTMVDSQKKIYAGIPAYDEINQKYKAMLSEEHNKALIQNGKTFYAIMKEIQKRKTKSSGIQKLQKFSEKHPDTFYGKLAARNLTLL